MVLLGNGVNRYPPFESFFEASLFGVRMKLPDISIKQLSPYEKILASLEKYSLITLLDLDGVLTHPVFQRGDFSQVALNILHEINKASDATVILTSRINPERLKRLRGYPGLRFLIPSTSRFPFLDEDIISKIKNKVEEGEKPLEIISGKSFSLSDRLRQFEEIINSHISSLSLPFIIYIFGSNFLDRRVVLRLCKKFPDLASRFVFIDTCHAFI